MAHRWTGLSNSDQDRNKMQLILLTILRKSKLLVRVALAAFVRAIWANLLLSVLISIGGQSKNLAIYLKLTEVNKVPQRVCAADHNASSGSPSSEQGLTDPELWVLHTTEINPGGGGAGYSYNGLYGEEGSFFRLEVYHVLKYRKG